MAPTVKIAQGTVGGVDRGGVQAFLGIPYAAAPYGPHRFGPPAPHPGWDGTRPATTLGPTALARSYPPPFDALLPDPQIPGEECLNLNVWTPEVGGTRLPVMVWIHGGAFTYGSSAVPDYDGAAFARRGVVFVSINYRLGVDGFALLPGRLANRGLLDQVAALRWVQDNIAAFGGDPDQVTVFGESAGAMSVTTLLSMPRAEGLFTRAIAQSGAGQHVHSVETAQKVTAAVAEHLGVVPDADAFAAVGLEALLDAQVKVVAAVSDPAQAGHWGELTRNLLAFEPVVDGEILTSVPLEGIRASAGATVDLLIGTNRDENRLFLVPTGAIDFIDDNLLTLAAGAYGIGGDALARYRANRPSATPGEVLCAVSTDWFFRVPAVRVAEARQGASGDTWMYQFTWPTPALDGKLGSCHALEIPFVFGNLLSPMIEGAGPEVEALAETMHSAWVRFATTGDPGWGHYNTRRRTTMRFDLASGVVDDPEGDERALWDGLR